MSLLWQARSLKDFTRLELVRPEQAQELGNGVFRAEVKFGDKMPEYSDQRSLWDISWPQCQFVEGAECAFAFGCKLDADWIGWFPKADELGNWPGTPNVGTGKGGVTGGSFMEFHHAPTNGDWANLWPPSAPFYFGANATDWRAFLLETDPKSGNFGGPRDAGTWLRPLQRGTWTEFVVHVLWSTDPAKGFIEINADGAPWVPRFQSATLYPGTLTYPQLGIYRRVYIGDPSLKWNAMSRPGVTYPAGFFPAFGVQVFPKYGGYPQSVQFRNPRIGTTKEDVMATPTPPATPAPASVAMSAAQKADWLKTLQDARDAFAAQAKEAQARADAITAQLNRGTY